MKFQVDKNNRDIFDNAFEETLGELNQAVMDSGAALEGNLFCARGDLVAEDLDGEWQEADNVFGRINTVPER